MPAQTCDGENEMWASPNNPMNPSWNASCEDCNGVANGSGAKGDCNVCDVILCLNPVSRVRRTGQCCDGEKERWD